MARCMEGEEKSLKQLKEITCSTCQEHFSKPELKVHPCLHHYCKQCILNLAFSTGKGKSFSCPECHKEATLPESWRSHVPVDEVDVGVEVGCAGSMKRLFQSKAKLIRLPVTLNIDRISCKADVNNLSEVVLYTTKLWNNKPEKYCVQIDCHLKSLHNGSVTECNIEGIAADQYRIQWTPTIRGQHELTVSVDGQQVAGSPFPVFVSIAPTQLGQPVKVWECITKPVGIAVNSVGEIIVNGFEGDVVVFDKRGKRLRNIKHSLHKFQCLQGIAVDSDDNIYFADIGTNRIFKSNKNCNKVEVHRVQQVRGPGHIDIAVVGDEVMVTERGNEGRIMVYDRELKYARQIFDADRNLLCYLSHDSHQNLYVSVPWNSSIRVFSNDGQFLYFFGRDDNGVERVRTPYGVHVAVHCVYVTDSGLDKIAVFTTEGDYVTSFGSSVYDVVCVDQDGFVYACNIFSNKIDIY